MRKTLLLTMPFMLAACDLEFHTDVGLKEAQSKTVTEGVSELFLELPSCHEHQDSRIESEQLVKAKEKFPQVFLEAKYVECFSKQMKSFAHFTVPVHFGEAEIDKYDILFKSTKRSHLTVYASKSLRKRLNDFSKENHLPNLNVKIVVNIKNNTGEKLDFRLPPVFDPTSGDPLENLLFVHQFEVGDTISLLLSNVASSALFGYKEGELNNLYGGAYVLLKGDEVKP